MLRLKFYHFQHVINLSFMDAAKGCNKDITTRMRVICNRCDGKRAEPGTTYSQCSTCKGTGEVGYLSFVTLQDLLLVGYLLIGTFRLDCKYEIECKYDFPIPNLCHFQSPCSSCWFYVERVAYVMSWI